MIRKNLVDSIHWGAKTYCWHCWLYIYICSRSRVAELRSRSLVHRSTAWKERFASDLLLHHVCSWSPRMIFNHRSYSSFFFSFLFSLLKTYILLNHMIFDHVSWSLLHSQTLDFFKEKWTCTVNTRNHKHIS
jgi:hypothetical protein